MTSDTGDSADAITNTWHFDSDSSSSSGVVAGINTKLTNFYQAMDAYIPSDLVGNTLTVKYYDLEDPEPRVPIATNTITLTPTSGNALPSECSAVLSFKGATASGVNMRRRRGRLYVGPLLTSVVTQSSGRVFFSSTFVTALTNAAVGVRDLVTTDNASWAVFSPTTLAQSGSLDDAFEDVTSGWVDNAVDIQRRRGTAPTIRTTW